MSSLVELLIRGIRSFDSEKPERIKFDALVTLIVGHNGAGKTTIIEALKYATTGELPPNAKGGAFVHDVKLANENEIRAQIKLRFRNVVGNDLVCTRSMQVTMSRDGNARFKTLESVLKVKHEAEDAQYSLSSKCAEIDKEVPVHLGVSKAILQNVIFCHQEDSFWPISDSATLKKKFDDIFAATRYTKALDNIRSLRKKIADDLRLKKNDLENQRSLRERSQMIESELEQQREQLQIKRQRISTLDGGEIQAAADAVEKLLQKQKEITSMQNRIDQLAIEKDIQAKNYENLAAGLEIMNETDEELQKLVEEGRKSIENEDTDIQALENDKITVESKLQVNQKELSDKYSLRGQFQAEENAYEKLLIDRKGLAITLFKKLGLENIDDPQDSDISQILSTVEMDQAKLHSELTSLRKNNSIQEGKLLEQLQELKSTKSRAKEHEQSIRKQVEKLNSNISDTNTKIQSLNSTAKILEEYKLSVLSCEEEISTFREKLNDNEKDSNLSQLTANLNALEQKAQEYREEMSILNLQSDSRAKLSLKKTDLKRKSEEVRSLREAIKEKSASFGHKVDSDTIEFEVDRSINSLEQDIKNLRNSHESKTNQISGIRSKLSMITSTLNQKTIELESKINHIKKICGEQDYQKVRSKIEEDAINHRDNVSSMKSASGMYRKFISKFNETKCCPLCTRKFGNESQETQFLGKLENILARVPNATKAAETELANAEAKLRKLKDIQNTWNDCERLSKTDIPELQKQKSELNSELEESLSTSEDVESEVAVLEFEIKQLRDLKVDLSKLSQLKREVSLLDSDVISLNQDLAVTGTTKTMEEAQSEYESVQGECKVVRNKIERLNKEHNIMQNSYQLKLNRLRDLQAKVVETEFKVKEREKLFSDLNHFKSEIQKLNENLEQAMLLHKDLPAQIEVAELNLQKFRNSKNSAESKFLEKIQQLKDSVFEISRIQLDIQKYKQNGGDQNLQRCKIDIERIEADREKLKVELGAVEKRIEDITTRKTEVQLQQRKVADNLRFRRYKVDIGEIEKNINIIKGKLKNINRQKIESEHNRLNAIHNDLLAERAQTMGEMRQLESNVTKTQLDYDKNFKDSTKKFLELKYDVKSLELSNEDLQNYYTSLDQAIMQFHSTKMAEINNTIKEIWMKTYTGIDIDTIKICSDQESSGSSLRKTYNYRVVMVKGGIEMDMKGRCSAGQKVLASIIIRLALAETFCFNCGILALDEPTTNLDEENCKGLARSLKELIDLRADQRNFQLLIITHDEDFVHQLGNSDYIDSYYQVEKDADGLSHIEKKSL